jgi:hypothetical protein
MSDQVTTLTSAAAFLTALATLVLLYLNREALKKIKEQVEAMNNQSTIMADSLKLEQLVKKHERLEKEMGRIVGLLHNNKDQDRLFIPKIANNEAALNKIGYDSFWRTINENMYLVPDDMRWQLINFILFIENYAVNKEELGNEGYNRIREQHKANLINSVDSRYDQLENEIQGLERELGWR